ncbi:hypothetical protein [Aliiglaciecola litoralis]|uniref:Peptidase M20 dimerisation domain-containing protein n=1 Tax=Aliiglaciecola litoralis TaxID=582857 RepID=A0ABP3X0D2_9ALTE
MQNQLQKVIGNDAVEFVVLVNPVESPIYEHKEDVMAAVRKAVLQHYQDVYIVPYMESDVTDGMHFRKTGTPTWVISAVFKVPEEMFAHGLNERLPIKAFHYGLTYWGFILKHLASNKA